MTKKEVIKRAKAYRHFLEKTRSKIKVKSDELWDNKGYPMCDDATNLAARMSKEVDSLGTSIRLLDFEIRDLER